MNGDPKRVGDKEKPDAKGAPELDRMQVKISHLDTLLGLTGEIIIAASNISILQRHLTGKAAEVDKETMDMVKLATLSTSRISSDLHHLVMDIRMVPIKETFLRFRRLVRDIAKKRGRQVNFEIVGEDTLVDKTVAERLYEPLAHQIRNAMDHGLEDPLERQHVGKDPTGKLILSAHKKEEFTYVSVEDDGRGLDFGLIREIAGEKGLIPPGAALSPDECKNLIMTPGFSTTRVATEISGRGVGMDVVKSTIESLGGEVVIESAPGKGSTFTYKIPQLSAVNITDAVIIRAGSGFFAIPVGNVVATHSIRKSEINTTMGRSESILYLDSILPLHDLLGLLSGTPLPEERQAESVSIVIIEAKNGRIACKVSEFIRPQKLVLIPLPEGFKANGISGTTILGGSQLGMIIDPFQLIAMACGTSLDANAYNPANSVEVEVERPAREAESDPAPAAGPDRQGGKPAPATAKPGLEAGDGLAEQFFVEIHDILKELNEDIFQLEKEPGSLPRINTIFRHFHSIKGNFMMTGFANVGAFVHEVESVLDRIREKTLEVDQGIVDLLLDAAKSLETGLAEIRAGRSYEINDGELLATLRSHRQHEAVSREGDEEGDAADLPFNFSSLGNLVFHAKMKTPGVYVFQSLLRLLPSFQESSLSAYLIIRRLTEVADLIDSVPSLERIEKGVVKDKIKIMFASRLPLDDINRFFKNQLQRHYFVGSFENMLMK
ncbi:MAG: Hpt domain-containing protein [Planctomycetota bacterium]|jgi:chemotaxis protein histidine kinase CheA|nr:Hpt domain-containing protein [Planctomycetota bacterium]